MPSNGPVRDAPAWPAPCGTSASTPAPASARQWWAHWPPASPTWWLCSQWPPRACWLRSSPRSRMQDPPDPCNVCLTGGGLGEHGAAEHGAQLRHVHPNLLLLDKHYRGLVGQHGAAEHRAHRGGEPGAQLLHVHPNLLLLDKHYRRRFG